jgi:aspartyl-tRNA(Asn)/glutamyl-tRNA(Gln) amidotransferase subunit B
MSAAAPEAVTDWEPVIGLETHVELSTRTKLFCGCPVAFGAEPNTQVCPTCLGLPGSLPVVNETAVRFTVMIGLALNCEIAGWCRFARKNYFYPDMPKNFQITQYDEPLCTSGWLEVDVGGQLDRVGIERVHLEEDTGKSLHVGGATGRIHGATHSLVDYNRAGIPLVEIVSRPDIRSAEAARAYVAELRDLLRGIAVSDVRMEQGSLRCDVNVSLRPRGTPDLGTRTETKNLNSLRSVERAVRHEIVRQAAVLESGGRVVQETRHFIEDEGVTTAGRSKETAEDYRYFPEPDLVALAPAGGWVRQLREGLPELAAARRRRLREEAGFAERDVQQLQAAGVLEPAAATVAAGASPDDARAWWLNELARAAGERGVEPAELPVSPEQVARVIALVRSGELTAALGRVVLDGVLAGEGDPDQVIGARGLRVVGDDATLLTAVADAIAGQPELADKVRSGKVPAVGALVGAVMKATGGKANAARARELLLRELGAAE